VLGTVWVKSGKVKIADPRYVLESDPIEGVPHGQFDLQAQMIRYAEGGQRIARISLFFNSQQPDSRRCLMEVGVDTAMVVVADEQVVTQHWKEVGPKRIGRVTLPGQDHLAQQIARQFGLTPRLVDGHFWEFEEPITEDLERMIYAYLRTVPECTGFSCQEALYFGIRTGNTLERLCEAMREQGWCEFVLDEVSGASVLAVRSGFGDGTYAMAGLYRSGQLIGLEVEFIGPAQDKLLAAFPMLRY
jgi:hypothetical protein